MTTVINNPAPVNNPAPAEGTGGSGFLIGAIVLIVLVVLIIFIGIPVIRRMGPVQVNVPAAQVNIPNKIDVNVSK